MHSNLATFLKKYDFSFFILMVLIFVIGVLNLYSATHAISDKQVDGLYKTQMTYFALATCIGIFASFVKSKTLFRYSYLIYIINVVLVIMVLIIGVKVLGARRWLDLGIIRFQPSEIMKLSLVLMLGRWYSARDPETDIGLKEMILPSIFVIIPSIIVIIQPDLGTGIILLLVFFSITFYRRLKWKPIIIIGILVSVGSIFMYQFGLKDYQKQRVITFFDPWEDVKGYGYNAIQSEIAIGSGQIFGKGFKKSSQASLSYLPENHTDFAFSVFNEEHGIFGSIILIGLYIALFMRFIWLSIAATNFYDSVIVIGLMSIFFWHTFINMSMTTGLLPIVGIPLPLISYGGSSLITFGLCCGIATSISNSRKLF
ncbi:MAG: rod shape-determining protein RodA [Oligoflexia bacterium]|nr:rod shape-determining protein RodA [Oligoflexia bacterium]